MKNYDEFKMAEAVIEYDRLQTVSALEVAERFGVPVAELHKAYAAHRAAIDKHLRQH